MIKKVCMLFFLVGVYGYSSSDYVSEKIATLEIGDITVAGSAVYQNVLIILGDEKIYTFDISDISNPLKLQEIDGPIEVPEWGYPGYLNIYFFGNRFLFYNLNTNDSGYWGDWTYTYHIYNCVDPENIFLEMVQELENSEDTDYKSSYPIGFNGSFFYQSIYDSIGMGISGFIVVDFSDLGNVHKVMKKNVDVEEGRLFVLNNYLILVNNLFKIYSIYDPQDIRIVKTWNHESVPGYSYIDDSGITLKNNVFYMWEPSRDEKTCVVDFSEPESPALIFGEVADGTYGHHPMDYIVNDNLFVGKKREAEYMVSSVVEGHITQVGEITGTTVFQENNGYLFAYENNSLCVYQLEGDQNANLDVITGMTFTPIDRDAFYAPVTVLCELDVESADGPAVTAYNWDLDGDSFADQLTDVPHLEYLFNTAGEYTVTAWMTFEGGYESEHFSKTLVIGELPGPVISQFTAEPVSGMTSLPVSFTVTAEGTESLIAECRWDFDGDGTADVTTTEAETTYTYSEPGFYTVIVDVEDSSGLTSRASQTITVNNGNPVFLPALSQFTFLGGEGAVCNTLVNTGSDTAAVSLVITDEGAAAGNMDYILTAGQKTEVDLSAYSELSDIAVELTSDSHVAVCTEVMDEHRTMSSLLFPAFSGDSIVSHIAEESHYWNTYAYLSNSRENAVSFDSNNVNNPMGSSVSSVFDLEPYLSDPVDELSSWGTFNAYYSSTPFGRIESYLSGFNMFMREAEEGAALEMMASGSTTLYIPHIPVDTVNFWTGITVVNLEDEDITAEFQFYLEDGTLCGLKQTKTIPANSKLKGVITGLFPDLPEGASFAVVTGTGQMTGAEIYGLNKSDGISGFSLNGNLYTRCVLPILDYSEDIWSGMALSNPNPAENTVTIQLVDSSGTVLEEKQETLNSNGRFQAVVEEYFETEIQSSYYIRLISDLGITAVEAIGDHDFTRIRALPAAN